MTGHRLAFVLLAVSIPGAITHCGASNDAGNGTELTSGSGTTMGIGVTTLPPGGAGGGGSEPESPYNPLCGGFDTHGQG